MGGSGKTPFSFALAEYLHGLGLKPCIISRGYKGRLKKKFI
jgi:tetraacyldisaccharide-1-P 4'-kinase